MKQIRGINAFLVGVVATALAGGGVLALVSRVQPAPIQLATVVPTMTAEPTVTPRPMRVHVSGHVVNPGVYELSPDSIVDQAVRAAGGFSRDADIDAVNLAQPLSDGVQIYIPAKEDSQDSQSFVVLTPAATQDLSEPASASTQLININHATLDELESLPGIGPALALRIVDYREAQGPFADTEAIMKVSGIGEAKYGQMKDLITVEGE